MWHLQMRATLSGKQLLQAARIVCTRSRELFTLTWASQQSTFSLHSCAADPTCEWGIYPPGTLAGDSKVSPSLGVGISPIESLSPRLFLVLLPSRTFPDLLVWDTEENHILPHPATQGWGNRNGNEWFASPSAFSGTFMVYSQCPLNQSCVCHVQWKILSHSPV